MTDAHLDSTDLQSAAGPFCPGQILHDTYRIIGTLARGGMGEIYEACHERLPGRFAIKAPHTHLCRDEAARSRFQREAHILAGLRHPNIVQVIDFNVAPCGTPYLVMELVEGADLRQHLRSGVDFAPARVGHIVGQIASALQAAHDREVVHLDLKLENVMLTGPGGDQVKLLDFGIARASGLDDWATDDLVAGTPQFMAPEQLEGAPEDIDDRADQFALASLAYTLLTGHEPFGGEGALAVIYQVLHREPRPLADELGPVYDRASRIIQRALDKQPVMRFATIEEFAGTLRPALAAAEGQVELVQHAA